MLFKKCFKNIKIILLEEIEKSNKNRSKTVSLQKLNNLYMCLVWNYRYLITFLQPSLLVIWISVMIIVICLFYILLLAYSLHEFKRDLFLEIRTYGILAMPIFVLTETEKLNCISEDILSFLFKYPISKLNPAEAAQVETLITTLHLQRPILKASDVFTVGTRLLASISGTVVTYVLVAL
ncbi:hypothetical protein ILUMI_24367 [Ignelater luminosus]|uniref:Uncharacterized protein n=1 Tax=Ignelater luminosus TaxID=2038154 RepID=A0A8K0CAD0_IGNLU|nr:hypothetical protein ILUMI_24367 [Ignelater luminosus]